MVDEYNLERFVQAQNAGGTYEKALGEIRRGQKSSHWMWFVFPQIAGLGQSPMAKMYAISSLAEAKAYLEHPVLGKRMYECANALLEADGTAEGIFGGIDAMKLRSSVTLFRRADPTQPVFQLLLDRFFDGVADHETEKLL